MAVDPTSGPESLRVEADTDQVRVLLPAPLDSGRRGRMGFVVLAFFLGFGAILAWLQAWPAVGLLGILGPVTVLLLTMGSRVRPTFIWPAVVDLPEIVLTRHSLEVRDERGHTAIPLASIRSVGISGEDLVVDWTEGRFDVATDLRPVEYHWLHELIADHAETARIAELEQGVDLDRPNVVPRAIQELVERER